MPATSGTSMDAKRRAQDLIPKIKQHLEQAEQIQAQLGDRTAPAKR
jgi:hypothetical protein